MNNLNFGFWDILPLFCCEVVLIYISEAFLLVHVNGFILPLLFTVKNYFIVVAEYVHKPWCLIQVPSYVFRYDIHTFVT